MSNFDSFKGSSFDTFTESLLGVRNQPTLFAFNGSNIAALSVDEWSSDSEDIPEINSPFTGNGTIRDMVIFDEDLWAFGISSSLNDYAVRWDGTDNKDAGGFDDDAYFGEVHDGKLYSVATNNADVTEPVWLWDDEAETWSNVGGTPTAYSVSYAGLPRGLETIDSGTFEGLYFSGNTTAIGGNSRATFWDISSGSFVHVGPSAEPFAVTGNMLLNYGGSLYAGGSSWRQTAVPRFRQPIWKYTGSNTWTPLGAITDFTNTAAGATSICRTLGTFNGKICAYCHPVFAGGSALATWDGEAWTELSTATDDGHIAHSMLDLGEDLLLLGTTKGSGFTNRVWDNKKKEFQPDGSFGGFMAGSVPVGKYIYYK